MTSREIFKKSKFILQGLETILPIPFLPKHQYQFRGKGQRPLASPMDRAESAYSAWLRTLIYLNQNGVHHSFDTVAELGPGDNFSMGLAALLTGTNHYVGLDVLPTAYNHDSLAILDVLVDLFRNRTPIPKIEKHLPRLSSDAFPDFLQIDLSDTRINNIRAALNGKDSPITITYAVPWDNPENLSKFRSSLDLIFSHAVFEHVDDPTLAYKNLAPLLKPNGILFSAIDYKCHHTAGFWNGHWTYSALIWKLIRGNSPYFINRWTHAMHLKATKLYFKIIADIPYTKESPLRKSDLAHPYNQHPFETFAISEGVIMATTQK